MLLYIHNILYQKKKRLKIPKPAFMRKYRAQLTLLVCCIIGLSICYDALDCITIDLLQGEELQGLTDAEFLYLPVGHLCLHLGTWHADTTNSDFIATASNPNHYPYVSSFLFVAQVCYIYYFLIVLLLEAALVVLAVAVVEVAFFLLGDLDCFNLGHPSPVIKCIFHPSSVAGSIAIKHNGHCTWSTWPQLAKQYPPATINHYFTIASLFECMLKPLLNRNCLSTTRAFLD